MYRFLLIFLLPLMSFAGTNYVIEIVTTNGQVMTSYPYDTTDNMVLPTKTVGVSPIAADRTRFLVTAEQCLSCFDGSVDAQAEYDALPTAVKEATIAARTQIINDAAFNIITLAATYGVTDQPISWTSLAVAMQAERADATASNDNARLLAVMGDGIMMLSFKEFYTENGGDIFNVVSP